MMFGLNFLNMWQAILAAVAAQAANHGFNALLNGNKGQTQTQPVQVPQMQQPDIIGSLYQMMGKKNPFDSTGGF